MGTIVCRSIRRNALDGHFEMAFNRLFLGPLWLQKRYLAREAFVKRKGLREAKRKENRYFFKDAWEGREGYGRL